MNILIVRPSIADTSMLLALMGISATLTLLLVMPVLLRVLSQRSIIMLSLSVNLVRLTVYVFVGVRFVCLCTIE